MSSINSTLLNQEIDLNELSSASASQTFGNQANNIENDEENDYSEFSLERDITEQCLSYAIPIFKLFIFFPGKLIRLFLQIGDFYYLLQILSITFEYITIILVACSRFGTLFQILYILLAFLFSCLMGNVLTIPMWELIQLRWINNKNPFQTVFNIFNLNNHFTNYRDRTLYFIDKITNFVCSIFFYIYFLCILDYFHSTGELFNRMNSIFLLFIPGIKFFIIYLSYIVKELLIFFCSSNISINEETKDIWPLMKKPSSKDPFAAAMITKRDLFEKVFDDEEKKCCKNQNRVLVFFILKAIIIFIQFIFLIYFFSLYKIDAGGVFFCLFVFLYISLFSLFISIPIWFFNLFTTWNCCDFVRTKQGDKLIGKMKYQFKNFKNISFICQILPFLIVFILFLFFCYGLQNTPSYFARIENDVKWDGEISGKYPYKSSITSVKSSMCYTTIHGLSLIQIAAIAAAPYYEDLDNYKRFMKNSFFKDSKYDFNLSFVRKEDNHAVLLRADFDDSENDKKVTIFSVRGTQTSNDMWLDIEMFVASAMLTVAKWIPFMQKQEGFTVKAVTSFMTLPLNLMVKSTLTYRYTSEMFDPIDKFLNDENNANRSVMFTGHSLGGGLSKVLAVKYEIQSVAVSGPGITPVENVFRNTDNYDRYFKSKMIDIVPDHDLVPRFEMSGGTRHRVLCTKNFGQCHNVLRTICQMGVSCNDEYHAGDFCSHAFSEEDYKEMKELADIQ